MAEGEGHNDEDEDGEGKDEGIESPGGDKEDPGQAEGDRDDGQGDGDADEQGQEGVLHEAKSNPEEGLKGRARKRKLGARIGCEMEGMAAVETEKVLQGLDLEVVGKMERLLEQATPGVGQWRTGGYYKGFMHSLSTPDDEGVLGRAGFEDQRQVAAFVRKADADLVEMVVNNLPQLLELARKTLEAEAAASA